MSTGPKFTQAFAPICGMHPSTLDRYMRELRQAGMIPVSGVGGGIVAKHLDHHHAATIILSLAAPTPSGAVDAAKRLGALCWENLPNNVTLASGLASTIANAAATIAQGHKPAGPAETEQWELTVCLEPLAAWMAATKSDEDMRQNFVARQPGLLNLEVVQDVHLGMRRQTIITSTVLNVAAELCADTLTRRN